MFLLTFLAVSDTSSVCSLDQKHNKECSSLLSSCFFGECVITQKQLRRRRVSTENTPADNAFHVTFWISKQKSCWIKNERRSILKSINKFCVGYFCCLKDQNQLIKTDKRKHCNQSIYGIVTALHEVVKISFILQNTNSLTLWWTRGKQSKWARVNAEKSLWLLNGTT